MRWTVPLDGTDWWVRGFLGVEGGGGAAARPGTDRPGWLPARVPGSVVDDLWRAGEIIDPYVGRNSLAAEWAAERSWLYRRTLSVPALRGDERAWLRFEGVDHAARIYVDGRELARHEGMFTPFEVPLTDVAAGDHDLAVLVEPAPDSEPQMGLTSRVRIHKSRMAYGWDFCPRIVHQGIWQPVTLEVGGPVLLRGVWARPELADDLTAGTVAVDVDVEGPLGGHRVEAVLADGDREIARGDVPAASRAALRLDVTGPRPWWPNGVGERAVHRLRVTLRDGAGERVDERDVPVGFRRIELAANDDGPIGARGYTVVVNGRPMHVAGWNWVPLDVLYGVPRLDRMEHLLRLASAAGVNLLRVWGGGLIETEAFYDACDRLGILVWQEFSQSSSGIDSVPASDQGFVDLMRHEAEAIVPLRRNHPSLAIWCGGNELEDASRPLDERHPVIAALRDVVARLDPDRAWLPTSPSGPRFHNRLDDIAADPDGLHDVHGPWEHQGLRGQYELYDRGTSLLNSEFGVEGMASRRTLAALVPPAERWPPTRANPVYRHLGDWWINEPLVQSAFGDRLHDLDRLSRASRFLQAEGLRYAVEANRRRAPRNSGSIPWQFNESYPNAWCTAAVEHRGDPKPAYFAVARAYRPVHVCAAFERAAWDGEPSFRATVWAWSFHARLAGAQIAAAVRDLDGRAVHESDGAADLEAGRPAAQWTVETRSIPAPLFFLDLSVAAADGRPLSGNRYLFASGADFSALLDAAPATVETSLARDGDSWRVEVCHAAGPAALGLVVEDVRPYDAAGWAEPSDSGFDLLPGERRTLEVRWADAPAAGRRLRIDGWNVAARDVD